MQEETIKRLRTQLNQFIEEAKTHLTTAKLEFFASLNTRKQGLSGQEFDQRFKATQDAVNKEGKVVNKTTASLILTIQSAYAFKGMLQGDIFRNGGSLNQEYQSLSFNKARKIIPAILKEWEHLSSDSLLYFTEPDAHIKVDTLDFLSKHLTDILLNVFNESLNCRQNSTLLFQKMPEPGRILDAITDRFVKKGGKTEKIAQAYPVIRRNPEILCFLGFGALLNFLTTQQYDTAPLPSFILSITKDQWHQLTDAIQPLVALAPFLDKYMPDGSQEIWQDIQESGNVFLLLTLLAQAKTNNEDNKEDNKEEALFAEFILPLLTYVETYQDNMPNACKLLFYNSQVQGLFSLLKIEHGITTAQQRPTSNVMLQPVTTLQQLPPEPVATLQQKPPKLACDSLQTSTPTTPPFRALHIPPPPPAPKKQTTIRWQRWMIGCVFLMAIAAVTLTCFFAYPELANALKNDIAGGVITALVALTTLGIVGGLSYQIDPAFFSSTALGDRQAPACRHQIPHPGLDPGSQAESVIFHK